MKAHLLYRDRDFDLQRKPPSHEAALTQDLELDTLFQAMAQGDEFLFQVAKQAVLSGLDADVEAILYRQEVLKDCLDNYSVVYGIYDIAVEALANRRKHWWGMSTSYPGSILSSGVDLVQMFISMLKKLKAIADEQTDGFASNAFKTLFSMLRTELAEEYFTTVQAHLKELKFRDGVLVSARLGRGNEGDHYVLRKFPRRNSGWIGRVFDRGPPSYTFHLHPRDEAGALAMGQLRNRGIHLVANAMAQSADHIESFFVMLRTELAFYLGCVNLHSLLAGKGLPVCFPVPAPPGARRHSGRGIYDVCLALTLSQGVVGNDLDADGKSLVVITGANQGGKSTFLRGIGLAQLMLQCGMFVGAESFSADIGRSLFTHYKREEDPTMKSGKFDEELSRMSGIVDALAPNSLLLFNESFAATNEREGSEIARQIALALLETPAKIFFVTHMYEFAHGLFDRRMDHALFLRAERRNDGARTFKLLPDEPLETSFGADLYEEIFGAAAPSGAPATPAP